MALRTEDAARRAEYTNAACLAFRVGRGVTVRTKAVQLRLTPRGAQRIKAPDRVVPWLTRSAAWGVLIGWRET